MNKNEFIQRVREFKSLSQSVSSSDYGKIVGPLYRKLKKVAIEEGFDFENIYNEVTSTLKKFEMRDKIVSHLRTTTTNPLTEELCEAMLNQFIDEGLFCIRRLGLKDDVKRGPNDATTETIQTAEFESLKVGLNIFINNIRNGDFDKVSSYYYEKIKSIGLEQLEKYLQTGERTKELSVFLKEVYENCYDYSNELIGTRDFNRKQSLQANLDKEKKHTFRIYFNMPKSTDAVRFLRDYQIACQKLGIDYCMKAFNNMEPSRKDTTIFYSTYEDLSLKLQIIKALKDRYPDIKLGSPPSACAKTSGLTNIGICHNGVLTTTDNNGVKINTRTYNDYIDGLSYLAFIHVFGTHLSSISPELAEKVKKTKNGDVRSGLDGMQHYKKFTKEEIPKIQTMIKNLLSDPLRKKVIVQNFKIQMQKCHNINQGYAYNLESNVALDMSYIDAEKVPEETQEKKIFPEQAVRNALKVTSTSNAIQADSIEHSKQNRTNIKEGESKDD